MLGDILRKEREKQNLTIKDVEAETSIRAFYIESIEKGNYDALPGEVYTKGFIKNYAAFLKLDANAFLQQYNTEMHKESTADQPADSVEVPQPSYSNTHKQNESFSKMASKSAAPFNSGNDFHARVEKSRRSQRLLAGVMVLLFVAGGAYFFWPDTPSTTNTVKQTKPAVTETKKPAAEKEPAQQEKKFDNVEISAKFTDACWTKVEADGKTIFEGTVEKGKSFSWKGQNKVIITAGNAGAIEITHNGKSTGKMGKAGEVVSVGYTKDKVEQVK